MYIFVIISQNTFHFKNLLDYILRNWNLNLLVFWIVVFMRTARLLDWSGLSKKSNEFICPKNVKRMQMSIYLHAMNQSTFEYTWSKHYILSSTTSKHKHDDSNVVICSLKVSRNYQSVWSTIISPHEVASVCQTFISFSRNSNL